MLIIAAILGILAIPLLLLGLRGKRVDDHPVCGRCKFDLVGVYPDRRVCPECGSRLGEPGGQSDVADSAHENAVDAPNSTPASRIARVQTGNRKRKRSLIAIGLLGLILAVALFGVSAPGVNWDKHKPFALLRLELYFAADGDPVRTRELLGEILSRLDDKKLSEKRLSPIVNQALRIQADPDATWMDPWVEIIERYDGAVGLSEEQLFAYLKEGGLATIKARESVRIGDEILIMFEYKPTRVGIGRRLSLEVRVVSGTLGSAEAAVPILPPPDSRGPRRSPVTLWAVKTANGESRMGGGFLLALDGQASDVGPQPLTIEFSFRIVKDRESKKVIGEWTETYDLTIEVLPRDDSDIQLFNTSIWKPNDIDVTVDSLAHRKGVNGGQYLIGKLTIQRSYPFAFRAVAIVGDARYDLGTLTRDWLQQGGDRHFQLYAKNLPDNFDAKSVDIELKYDRAPARHRMDMTKIYPLDMLIKDVPIEWPDDPDLP